MSEFTISKWNHYANGIRFEPVIGKKTCGYRIKFDNSCVYRLANNSDQKDVNKLCGWSHGIHQKESTRMGWRYDTESRKIELLPYLHVNGNIVIPNEYDSNKCYIDIDKDYYLYIELDNSVYRNAGSEKDRTTIYFTVTEKMHGCENTVFSYYYRRPKLKWYEYIGYKLYPYFGGNSVAPKNMSLTVDEI